MDYDFTARVEEDFDRIAEGKTSWENTLSAFYTPFHSVVGKVMNAANPEKVERLIGKDPATGEPLTARFGKFGAYIQKGEGANRQFASLGKGQLIETITLAEALKLFELPRNVGEINGIPVIATKGRYGPYLKYGEKNMSLPRGKDPLTVTLEECAALLAEDSSKTPVNAVLASFDGSGIQIINGKYGPYLKKDGANYKIPRGKDAAALTEAECLSIINESGPAKKTFRKFSRKK